MSSWLSTCPQRESALFFPFLAFFALRELHPHFSLFSNFHSQYIQIINFWISSSNSNNWKPCRYSKTINRDFSLIKSLIVDQWDPEFF
uniref:Uncharacterized protein n=1 Tax=Meloidogyne enterolobii TaxID=390850 RepID=A0A6V7VHR6_MELEN|nr:unnamed protein product [Meloidogyne enterolobii]